MPSVPKSSPQRRAAQPDASFTCPPKPDRAPAPSYERLPGRPARPDNSAATPDGPAHGRQATERSRKPGKAATVERQPGAAAYSPARMTMLQTTLKSAKTSLCASRTSAFFFSQPQILILPLRLLTAEPKSSQSLAIYLFINT